MRSEMPYCKPQTVVCEIASKIIQGNCKEAIHCETVIECAATVNAYEADE